MEHPYLKNNHLQDFNIKYIYIYIYESHVFNISYHLRISKMMAGRKMKTNIWTKFNKMKKTLSNYLTCLLTGPPECVDFSDFILFMDIVLNSPSDGQWGNVSRVARRNFKKADSANLSCISCNLVNFFIFAIFSFSCWNLECFMPVKI